MTIYEESEEMTIKRIEVALRNVDMDLLKEASYKLHERYHNGCSFGLLNELEQILNYVRENDIPKDIKDILCPTIEEILSKATEPETFTPQEQESNEMCPAPFREGNDRQQVEEDTQQQIFQEQPQQEPEITSQEMHKEAEIQNEEEGEIPQVAVFWGTKNDLDYTQLKNYKNSLNALLSNPNKEHDFSILNTLPYLTDEEENTEALEEILSFFEKTSSCPLCIVTTSQTSNLARYLSSKNTEFYVPNAQMSQKGYGVMPLLGLKNLFACTTCGNKTLSFNSDMKILCAKCPDCGGVALPDIQGSIYDNPKIWQRAFFELSKAKIWILVNPPWGKDEEEVLVFLQNACEIAQLKEVHIITDNKDAQAIYSKMITMLNPACVCRTKSMPQRSAVSA